MSTGSCCLSSLFLIVCFVCNRSSTSALASEVPSPEATAADQYPANIVEERVFGGAAAAAAIGTAGQSIDWSDSTKTGHEGQGVDKRTPISESSGYYCCIGDIFCVRGRCESTSSLMDSSWMNKRSQWRHHAFNRRLHLENL